MSQLKLLLQIVVQGIKEIAGLGWGQRKRGEDGAVFVNTYKYIHIHLSIPSAYTGICISRQIEYRVVSHHCCKPLTCWGHLLSQHNLAKAD